MRVSKREDDHRFSLHCKTNTRKMSRAATKPAFGFHRPQKVFNREMLWCVLRKFGCPKKFIALI